jgi:Poly A polymerase head domain/Probable RNA and SrmB- binding site of polymerase A
MSQIQLSNFTDKIKIDLKKMNQWPAIDQIFQSLNKKNRLCWISGGAVRDILLSKTPLDIDLTTDASDEEILRLFPQAILTGKQFGVYKIPLMGEVYDLAVFREEDEYVDGRRPIAIRRSTPDKDAQRRDFTVNGLFWDLKNEELVDYVGGLKDLEAKILRCVGTPSKRFDEDYLRVLRMIRLGYTLDFEMDPESYRAGLERAQSLTKISGERILAELLKLSELNSRLKFYADPLFASIMKHNDLSLLQVESKVQSIEGSKSVGGLLNVDRILIELLYFIGFNLDNIKRLQLRLKIGNDVKKWLMKTVEVNSLIEQKSGFVVFCLLIDRSKDFLILIRYFNALGLLEKSLFQQIETAHEKFPTSLVSAIDILHLVPAQMLSKVLMNAREWQILNEITERDSVLDYIRKSEQIKA